MVATSCRVGPAYHRPRVADDSWNWKNQTVIDTVHSTAAYARTPGAPIDRPDSFKLDPWWWKVFADDTLNTLVDKALANNPSLQTAAYRIVEARALVNSARANYFPVITLDPNISRNQLSGNRPNQINNTQLQQFKLTTITFPLDMTYEFDLWGKFRRNVESVRASMNATEADQQVIRLSLTSDIATNYLMLRLIDSQIELYTRSLILRNENLKLTQIQYTAGLATKLDVSQAEIEAGTVEAQLIDTRRSRALSENAIAVLCGIPAMQLQITPRTGLPAVPLIPLEVPADLLQRRPDIVEAEQQLISANAQIGVAQAAFLPSLRITAASAGYLSSRPDNLFDQRSQTWIGGVGISIPIFAGGRNIAQKDVAVARMKESQSTYRQVVLTAYREVQDAMSNVEFRGAQLTAQQKVLASSRTAAILSKELYTKGLTTYVNVILADRAVLDAENTYISVVGQQLFNSITLIKALGGGWNGLEK